MASSSATITASSSSSFKIPEQYGHFKRSAGPVNLQESYNQDISVVQYTSGKTGLRVVLVDVEGGSPLTHCTRVLTLDTGPLCNLFASVATEIVNDSGCPHTLEQ